MTAPERDTWLDNVTWVALGLGGWLPVKLYHKIFTRTPGRGSKR